MTPVPVPSWSNTPLSAPWVTNGSVTRWPRWAHACTSGDRSAHRPETGPGALFDESKAGYAGGAVSLEPGFPQVNGPINAVRSVTATEASTSAARLPRSAAWPRPVWPTYPTPTRSTRRRAGRERKRRRAGQDGHSTCSAGGSFNGVDGKDEADSVSLDPRPARSRQGGSTRRRSASTARRRTRPRRGHRCRRRGFWLRAEG